MVAKDFKNRAKDSLANYHWLCVGMLLVYFLIEGTLSSTGIGLLVVGGPLELGLVGVFVCLADRKPVAFEDLFKGFDDFGRVLVVYLLRTLFVSLWYLLFFVPGFVKCYSYAASMYILKKDPNISANDAITKSRQVMDGNKWRLFCLRFSFFWWILLGILTFGILLILYVIPYMQMAEAEFFKEILKDYYPEEPVCSDTETNW